MHIDNLRLSGVFKASAFNYSVGSELGPSGCWKEVESWCSDLSLRTEQRAGERDLRTRPGQQATLT